MPDGRPLTGPVADGQGTTLALERVCAECGGIGRIPAHRLSNNAVQLGGSCNACFGVGTQPTEDGVRLLAFLRRHAPH